MKAVAISSLAIAIALSAVLGDAILPTASTPQFEAEDLTSRNYHHRGTGRREIMT